MSKQVLHLIAEDRDTTRFEANDRSPGNDMRPDCVQDLQQHRLCQVEHAKVIERTSAAERGFGHDDLISGILQHFNRSTGDGRMELVVECIRPQHHLRSALVTYPAFLKPLFESLGGKLRHLAMLRNPAEEFDQIGSYR